MLTRTEAGREFVREKNQFEQRDWMSAGWLAGRVACFWCEFMQQENAQSFRDVLVRSLGSQCGLLRDDVGALFVCVGVGWQSHHNDCMFMASQTNYILFVPSLCVCVRDATLRLDERCSAFHSVAPWQWNQSGIIVCHPEMASRWNVRWFDVLRSFAAAAAECEEPHSECADNNNQHRCSMLRVYLAKLQRGQVGVILRYTRHSQRIGSGWVVLRWHRDIESHRQ